MTIVVLPAFNEEQALPLLLDEIARIRETELSDLRVIVVDDGSTDATAQIVAERTRSTSWIKLTQHEGNQGLSQAIRTGFRVALEQAAPDDVIVTLDADNTQPPDTIPHMLSRIEGGDDVVIASRFRPGAEVHGVPPMRRLYSRVMSTLFGLLFPISGVRDYSCGFRAYRSALLRRAYDAHGEAFIIEQGFACMVEILFKLDRLGGVRFGEVPFVLRYDLKPTQTKMKVLRNIVDTLRVAFSHRFKRGSL